MLPEIWGTHFWHMIHFIALNYKDNPSNTEQTDYGNYFKYLGYVLPCEKCAEEYNNYIDKHPPQLESRNSLFEWTVSLHNHVNMYLNKQHMECEDAKLYYEKELLHRFYMQHSQ